jgi:hypothetical protein
MFVGTSIAYTTTAEVTPPCHVGREHCSEEIVLDATTRHGNAVQCNATVLPLGAGNDGAVSGAIIMMEPTGD